jgi:hypothetical protein
VLGERDEEPRARAQASLGAEIRGAHAQWALADSSSGGRSWNARAHGAARPARRCAAFTRAAALCGGARCDAAARGAGSIRARRLQPSLSARGARASASARLAGTLRGGGGGRAAELWRCGRAALPARRGCPAARGDDFQPVRAAPRAERRASWLVIPVSNQFRPHAWCGSRRCSRRTPPRCPFETSVVDELLERRDGRRGSPEIGRRPARSRTSRELSRLHRRLPTAGAAAARGEYRLYFSSTNDTVDRRPAGSRLCTTRSRRHHRTGGLAVRPSSSTRYGPPAGGRAASSLSYDARGW